MISLSSMKTGSTGTITDIHGGHRMLDRLASLGIRTGRKVKKVSQQAMRGPAVVEVDRSQVAVGFGMASKIFVEIDEESTE
jgi:ferrous iron transport protein A